MVFEEPRENSVCDKLDFQLGLQPPPRGAENHIAVASDALNVLRVLQMDELHLGIAP